MAAVKLSDITSVGRAIDPHYPTNRAIVLLALVVFLVGTALRLLEGGAWGASLGWGLGAAVSVFLAWALGRELDPDHPLSAFVAAGLALAGLFLFHLPELLPLFWMLVLLRIVDRSVGLPARIWDSLGLLALGAWLGWQGTWIYGPITAVAFLLDAVLPPTGRRQLILAVVALLFAIVTLALRGTLRGPGDLPLLATLAVLAMSALFVLVAVSSRRLRTVGDATGLPLHPPRVQAGQGLALLFALLLAWWAGSDGVMSLLPLWAAILGTGLVALLLPLLFQFQKGDLGS